LNSIIGLTGQIENMPIGPSVRDDVLSALEELSQVGGSIDEAGTILN
jgi:hypothetical protein